MSDNRSCKRNLARLRQNMSFFVPEMSPVGEKKKIESLEVGTTDVQEMICSSRNTQLHVLRLIRNDDSSSEERKL